MASVETCQSSVEVLGNSINEHPSGEFVFVDERDHQQNASTDEARSLADGDMTSMEYTLMSRLRELAEENEGLKSVLHENNNILQNCFQELHNWQAEQKENHDKVIERHKEAKEIIIGLKKKNEKLKKELEEVRGKPSDGEDGGGDDSEMMSKIKEIEEENKMLLQEKLFFEKNFGTIQSQIKQLISTNEDQSQFSMEDSLSMLRIVDTLMDSMNYQDANTANSQLQKTSISPANNNNVDHNMNEVVKLKTELEKVNLEKTELMEKLENLEKERSAGSKDTDELRINLETMTKEFEKLKTENESIQKEVKVHEKDKEEKANCEEKIAKLTKQLEACLETKREVTEQIGRKDEQIAACKKANAILVESTNSFEEELTALTKKNKAMEVTLNTRTAELKSVEEQLHELESNKADLQEQVQLLQCKAEENLTQAQSVEQLQSAVGRHAEDLEVAENKVQELEAENAKLLKMLDMEREKYQMKQAKPDGGGIPLQGSRLKEEYEALKLKYEHLLFHNEQVEARNTRYLNQLERCKEDQNESKKQFKLYAGANQELQQYKETNNELRVRLQDYEDQKVTLERQVCTVYQDVIGKEEELEVSRKRIVALQDKSRKDAQRISSLEKEKDNIKKEFQELLEQNGKLMKDNHEMLERLQEALGSNRVQEGQQEMIEAELKQLKDKQNEDAAKRLASEEVMKSQEQELTKRAQAISRLQQQVNNFVDELNVAQETGDHMRAENIQLREQLAILQQRTQRMEEQLFQFGNSQMEEMMRRHGTPPASDRHSIHHSSSSPNIRQQEFPDDVSFEELIRHSRGVSEPREERDIPEENQIPDPCPVCGDQFLLVEELQNHIGGCLVANEEPTLTCPSCHVEFPDLDTLQIHTIACLDQDDA